ncbi:MAG TPA: hypothetical protein VN958_20105, partial [Chitinophagaceae bacterium]|nr:hypothetical protein [Chitinophagaceae bacterium]
KSTSLLFDYKIFTLPGLVIFWMIISVASRMVASKKNSNRDSCTCFHHCNNHRLLPVYWSLLC